MRIVIQQRSYGETVTDHNDSSKINGIFKILERTIKVLNVLQIGSPEQALPVFQDARRPNGKYRSNKFVDVAEYIPRKGSWARKK